MVTRRARQRGVTFIALLLAIALVSGVLAASATVLSQAQRREREKQLLWAGDQIRRAIAAYALGGAAAGAYPRQLEDLLEDARSPAKRRYLRQIYDDPMTHGGEWELIRNPQGGIIGVHTRFEGKPIKSANFPAEYSSFESAESYADWKFAAAALAPVDEQSPGVKPKGAASTGDRPDGSTPAGGKPGSSATAAKPGELPGQSPAISRPLKPAPGQPGSSAYGPRPLQSLPGLQSPFAPQPAATPSAPAAAKPPPPPATPAPQAPPPEATAPDASPAQESEAPPAEPDSPAVEDPATTEEQQ